MFFTLTGRRGNCRGVSAYVGASVDFTVRLYSTESRWSGRRVPASGRQVARGGVGFLDYVIATRYRIFELAMH